MKKGCGCLIGAVAVIGIIIAIAIYLLQPKWHDEYGQRLLDISYGNRIHNTYDLYLPPDAASTDSLALILYVHGGSWLGGDKSWHHSDCYQWVQKGYVTATMNYSLLNEEGVSLLTMLNDIEHCIEHIDSLSNSQGIHIRQMAIAGTSAGGHLAMLFAYRHCHPLPLQFQAIKVGPSDFRILFPYNGQALPQDVASFVFSCTGQHIDTNLVSKTLIDSIELQASPVHYITDSTALPAIFAYGLQDQLIKPAHYHALKTKYDSLGKSYDLIVFPNSGHELMHDKDCSERYDSLMDTYCQTFFGY